ncbi:rhodanese-like domain-containing protein [Rhodohalobacter sulfatireducens]|uniref:Rhodanese-like domain-containing protein n=1 Tax=Rhodohalobacter sulfatireducens TaxID=2911366 RepID=A0ABS9KFH0_9BACT|nr:rhodanese-like domain-containing protein [Rhodohalobacter sulfatireducens]MCG2589604.1 rhodanese-like domain-containing protein [Rhodohalobacter sulfatireducens]MDR9364701.1 rhodanese-like domain-containing protein [Balneolaceae bacterium]MDR9410109.1 rhodanese-like domain-containing protein [Balneolaceae bacterium]
MLLNKIKQFFNRITQEVNMSQDIDISPEEFKNKMEEDRGVIIDVRSHGEYKEGHLKETDLQHDYNSGEFQQQLGSLDKEKSYYLYCRTGNRSGRAARIMKMQGFEKAYNIGGFKNLAHAGFETERG